jgi:hypothetical protein
MNTLRWMVCALALLVAAPARAAGTIDFVLVLDESGSMEYAAPRSDTSRLRIDSAKLFVQLCGPDDRVGVVGFGEEVTYHTGQTLRGVDARWKSFVWQRLNSVSGLQAHTDMFGGLKAASLLLDARPSKAEKTFIVFLSDGKIDGPRDLSDALLQKHGARDVDDYKRKLLALADDCAVRGYQLLSIGLGTGADGALLGELATRGNGRYWPAPAATELQAIYSDIFINLADRFSLKAKDAHTPIRVHIEPGLKEFVALAFPRDPVLKPKPFLAGFRLLKDGKEVKSELSATKSWSAARLRNPEAGVWEVHFDPSLKVDILLVKHSGCRIHVNSPNLPEYPPGPVPLNVQVTDPEGRPADTCAGEVEAEISGGSLSAPVTVKLNRSGPGHFQENTPALNDEGEYTALLRAFAPGGREFVNQRTITFRIKVQPPRELTITIKRPDAPAYLAGGAVPVEVEVTAPGGSPLLPGQITLEPSLTGPGGALAPPNLTEETPGFFKGFTSVLTQPGTYSAGVRATFGSDKRTAKSASKDFVIQEKPAESLTLQPLAPKSGGYWPGAMGLKCKLSRANGAPCTGGEASVSVDISGPGSSQRATLKGDDQGVFSGHTPALSTPGKYRATFRGQLNGDPRSLAQGRVEFDIHAPTLRITNVQLVGEQPLFAGETFEVQFDVEAAGIAGAPAISAQIEPPGTTANPVDVTPEDLGKGRYRIVQEKTTLGAGRCDITATAQSAGAKPITTAVAVPIEAFLDVKTWEQSVEGETPTTYSIGILSLFPDPVWAEVGVDGVKPDSGATGSVPAITPTSSVGLTRPETTDDFTAYPMTIQAPSDASYGSYKTDLTVQVSGKYPDGAEFTRQKKVPGAAFQLNRPPMSPGFWLFLLVCAAAGWFVRPNFGGTWLKVGEDRVGIGERVGSMDTRVGVGGPEQPVSVVEEECTPVVLTAGWFGKFRRETTEGSFDLKSGDTFEVGRQTVKFVKGKEPPVKAPPSPDAPPPDATRPGALDDIA